MANDRSANGFTLSGPRRSVPLPCRLQFLFGGFLNQVGWAIFGGMLVPTRAFTPGKGADGLFPFAVGSIFALIGLAMLSRGLFRSLRGIRLLRTGFVTTGRLERKRQTDEIVDNKPVYELRFRFKTFSGAEAVVMARTHEPEHLEDDAEEPLVYDPADPSSAVLLDELPGRPRLDVDSVTQTEGSVLPLLVLPTVTLLTHAAWYLIR